ncbi:hypothetical protein [Nitrospirillum pindoramense]|uniref:CopL family metal-binding regulatory protein n=1 Tax=Nitrospirillum amazonense TaxID=28077 RepID=A0A560GUC7_9PROT|nr:hypothetical protein [Nitrospirillum amazonense]TWB37588.1 hypothetical protein FBZ90_11475 [Nitrospirillum amazonense]
MIRSSLPFLLAFLTLVAVVTGWSGGAWAHDCMQHPQMAVATPHQGHAHSSAVPTPRAVAAAAHGCHQAADCCCVGGMAGCAAACVGALVPAPLPDAGRSAAKSVLLPSGDAGGAGLALAPALGPPRATAFA